MPLIPTPRYVDVELTSRCNSRCRYCYYLNNEGVQYSDLSTQRWFDFFEELGRAGIMRVCLSGGEALMRRDFRQLLESVVQNRMRFELLTNGKLVTRELATFLLETKRCSSVQVSLDGSVEEIHESMRGTGTFEPALRAIRLLHKAGLPTTVRVTIHGRNVDDLPRIAELLLDDIGLPSFSTNAISSLGTHAKYDDDVFLTPCRRLQAMHIMASLDEQYPGRIEASAGPLAEWHAANDMEQARREGRAISGRGKLVGCGCIFSRLAVRADGAYVPCVMLPNMVLGHVGQDDLEMVWREAPELVALRQRIHVPLTEFEECRGCSYIQQCTGNCAGNAWSLTDNAMRPSPEGCLRRFQAELAREGLSIW